MKAGAAVVVLAAVVIGAAGCSADSTLAPAPATTAPTSEPAPTPTGTPLDYELPADDVEDYPQWDSASREQAVSAGDAVMRAFVRPAPGADASPIEAGWWEALAPLLTPEAKDAYFYVDPAEVPAMTVTGPAALVEPQPGTTAFLATVQVPTDVGTYEVLLARTGGRAPWLAERISPPESLSAPPSGPPVADAPA